MKTHRKVSLLLTPLTLMALVSAVRGQMNDMFPTKAAAEQRAKELNCRGSFAMAGEWMPCPDIEAYYKAIRQESK